MSFSELYIMDHCDACCIARDKLEQAGIQFAIIKLDDDNMQHAFKVWEHRLGHNPNSVPQFWHQGEYVGNSAKIDKFLKEKNVT